MIEEELFALEREAERRVREVGDREIEKGGPGSGRRASEAMDAPMLEAAAIRTMRQRFGDLRVEIDHHRGVLRRVKRNPDLPLDVRRFRTRQVETKLGELAADYKALEAEAESMIPTIRQQPMEPTSSPSGRPPTNSNASATNDGSGIRRSNPTGSSDEFVVTQPETYLGSLVPDSKPPADKRERQTPVFLVPGQGSSRTATPALSTASPGRPL